MSAQDSAQGWGGGDGLTPELLAVTYGLDGEVQHIKVGGQTHIVRVGAAQTLCGSSVHAGIKGRTASGQATCRACREAAERPRSPAELAASYGLEGEVQHVKMGGIHVVRAGQDRALCGSVISGVPTPGPGIRFMEDRPLTTEGRATCRNCQNVVEGGERRALTAEYGPDKNLMRLERGPRGSRAEQLERELFRKKR